MTVIFDGKSFAARKQKELERDVSKLAKREIVPKLASIIVGDNPASVLYVNLKKRAAERIGAKLEVRSWSLEVSKKEVIEHIKTANKDKSVHGIMVQLPLPKNFSKKDRDEIINSIARKKDVDGLRDDSLHLTPTVKSVLQAIKEATAHIMQTAYKDRPLKQDFKIVVVGAKGFEGKKIFKVLEEMGYDVEGIDRKTPYRSYLASSRSAGEPARSDFTGQAKNADILISVTGSPGIIGKDDIKEGAVVIDVGSPKGDVRTEEIIDKAAFISPVPGGLGPVTISCLLENLVESASNNK